MSCIKGKIKINMGLSILSELVSILFILIYYVLRIFTVKETASKVFDQCVQYA